MSHYTHNAFHPDSENNSWAHLIGYVTESSKVLDIGCSSGNFGEALIKVKNCTVVGLDIDAADVKRAQKKLTKAYVRNIETDKVSDLGKFDFVILADVIEHLVDPVTALEKVKKLLKPNGVVLFSIPNMAHISIRLGLLKGFFEYTDTGLLDRTHIHYYDEVGVDHVFAEAGYKITNRNPTTVTYPPAVIAKQLTEIGLEGSLRFYEAMDRTRAQVFEFIGRAEPQSKKVKQNRGDYVFPTDELSREIAKRDETIVVQQSTIDSLNDIINQMRNSRSWKITKPLRRANKRRAQSNRGEDV